MKNQEYLSPHWQVRLKLVAGLGFIALGAVVASRVGKNHAYSHDFKDEPISLFNLFGGNDAYFALFTIAAGLALLWGSYDHYQANRHSTSLSSAKTWAPGAAILLLLIATYAIIFGAISLDSGNNGTFSNMGDFSDNTKFSQEKMIGYFTVFSALFLSAGTYVYQFLNKPTESSFTTRYSTNADTLPGDTQESRNSKDLYI